MCVQICLRATWSVPLILLLSVLRYFFPFPPNPLWLAGLFSLRFYRFGLFSRLGGNWRAVIMDEQRALSYGG